MRLCRIRVRASNELRVTVRVVPQHLLHDALDVDGAVTLRAQALGDADDPRRDRRALRHLGHHRFQLHAVGGADRSEVA